MKIEPKILNNVCISTHPQGVVADTRQQIASMRMQLQVKHRWEDVPNAPNALIIGCSGGFGLASRIALAFNAGANTVGVALEKAGSAKRPGTPGYYANAAFEAEAQRAGLKAQSLNGDAFSSEIKQQTIAVVREFCPQGLDFVIYSLASPQRTDPVNGKSYRSVLKPIGQPFVSQTVDFMSGKVSNIEVPAATAEEQEGTVKVMGGEDWALWLKDLQQAGVLAEGVQTLAYSYIGPELTYPIYWNGTIGRAKQDLEQTATRLSQELAGIGGKALISVNKALVTRASSVIPVVPLYVALLYKVMKRKGLHEECIEQMSRLFARLLRSTRNENLLLDEQGRIRMDDWEMRINVQREVAALWNQVHSGNLAELADLEGFRQSYLRIHGFGIAGIDYEADIDPLAMPEL